MNARPKQVVVAGGFDDLRSHDLRFLEEAAKLGEVSVLPWPDELVRRFTGQPPRFPFVERRYLLNAVRYVSKVIPTRAATRPGELPDDLSTHFDIWADRESPVGSERAKFCRERNLVYRVFVADELKGFPEPAPAPSRSGRKKVVVTGSYDWLHSGHVRFFEEVSAYGDLYVVVGHDANIQFLKGKSHPLLPQAERRYMVGSIRYVWQVLISSGHGWLDADPEMQKLNPDIYAVNEEGDQGGKREYCRKNGIEYLVLRRAPAPGLPSRSSTDLRGY